MTSKFDLEERIRELTEENYELRKELGEFRRDVGHIIDLRDDGYTIQHPLSCRPNLFDCIYNFAAANFPELGQHPNGRFRVTEQDGQLFIEEEVG